MTLSPEVLEAFRRQSHIALTKDGVWRFHEADVAHERVQSLFHHGIEVRSDGEVILHVGRMWCYVDCETVAYFADGVAFLRDGRVRLRFRHGLVWETRALPTLGFGPDGRVYLWVDRSTDGASNWSPEARPDLLADTFVATCSRAVHQEIAGRLMETEPPAASGACRQLEVSWGAQTWPVHKIAERIGPTSLPPSG